MNRAVYNDIRLMVGPDGTLYAWDASDAIHGQIALFYGFSWQDAILETANQYNFDQKIKPLFARIKEMYPEQPGVYKAEIVKVPAPVAPIGEMLYQKMMEKFGSKALDMLAQEMAATRNLAASERPKTDRTFADWIERITHTPEFLRWFRKSDVHVDGEPDLPRIMYHGTTANFDVFETGDIGFHFGSIEAARNRLESKGWGTTKTSSVEEEKSGFVYGSSIMPVFLSIQNPLEMQDIGSWHRVDSVVHYLKQDHPEVWDQFTFEQVQALTKILARSSKFENTGTPKYKDPKWIHIQQEGLQIIREALWDMGYDGIKYKNKVEDIGHTSYIAFAPEQIKTIYNKGTWSDEYGEVWAALAKQPVTFQAVMDFNKPNALSKVVQDALKATGLSNYPEVMKRTQLILKPWLTLKPTDVSPRSLKEWAHRLNMTEAEMTKQLISGKYGFSGLTNVVDPMHAVVSIALRMHKTLDEVSLTAYHEMYHLLEQWVVPQEVYDKMVLMEPDAEKRADMFRDYVVKLGNTPAATGWQKIWNQILEFLQDVRRGLLGLNVTSAEQVFGLLQAGKFNPHFRSRRLVNRKYNEWISDDLLNDLDQIDTDKVLRRILSTGSELPSIAFDSEAEGKKRVHSLVESWMRPHQETFSFMYPTNIQTKEFKNWFEGSVVQENGNPIETYHGTVGMDDFDVFKDKLGRAGWFTQDPELADRYAEFWEWSQQDPEGNRVLPVYLSIKTPFRLPFDINAEVTPAYFHKKSGLPGSLDDWFVVGETPYGGWPLSKETEHAAWMYFKLKSLNRWLKQNGFDGVFAREADHPTWLAFDSRQVKSVFNKGTWSKRASNIMASIGETPWTPDQKTQAREEQDLTMPGIIELPEMIQLVQLISGGKIPGVREKLFGRDEIRGVFMPSRGTIRLKADLFKDPLLAARVLAHEIGHLVDWLPDHIINGNILGKIASIRKFIESTLPFKPGAPGALTPADIQRLREEAIKLLGLTQVLRTKWIDDTIVTELKVTPQDILNIWNAVEKAKMFSPELYKYVAGLDAHAKKLIAIAALKGLVPLEVEKFAKTLRGVTTKKQVTEVEYIPPTQEEIAKKLAALIEKEMRTRKLWVEEEVRDELKTLSARWRPFDPSQSARYTHYRWSAAELYADAVSVLFNDPAFLKAQAPKFYEAFFNYLDAKPDVKRAYDEIQRVIRSGEVDKVRTERIYEMFDEGNEAYGKQYEDLSPSIPDAMKRDFIDTFHFIIKDIRKVGEGNIAVNANPRYKLEEMVYTGSEIEAFLTDLYANVIKPLERANLKWDREFGFLVFLRRLAIERDKIAAPLGWDAEKAINKMEAMKNVELKPEQWEALKTAVAKFRELHERYFIDKAEANQVYDDDLIKLFRDNTAYATFDVLPYLIERYGHAVATRVYHQIGTPQKISNPATATVMKDIAFMKAVNKNTATRAVVKFYQDYANVLGIKVEEAHKKWNGRFQAIQEPKDRAQGLVVYLYKGKAYGYYLPKDVAEAINSSTTKYASVARVFRWLSQPFRKIFTELNYGFWIFNAFFRDAQRMVMALPGMRVDKFAYAWLRGLKPAFKSVFGIPDDVVQQMQRGRMLISIASVHDMNTEDEQLERLLSMYHMKPHQVYQNKILKPFGHLFNWVSNRARLAEYYFSATGRALERTTKIGTYKYLKENFPDMPDEAVGHIVRNRGGSPDFLRAGREQSLYNNILLFSNAMKEGYRGDVEAFKENPGEFMIKKFAFMVVPKLLMYAGLIGLLGAGIKDIFEGVTEYDLTNYIIIPLGRTQSGKSVYWRIPTDETSRFLGGVLWKIFRAPELGIGHQASDLFDYMAGQAPTVSPALGAIADTLDYVGGKNPYDRFYGRHAVGDVEFTAYDKRAHLQFLQYLASKMGSSIVYKFKHDKVEKIAEELESVLGFPINSKVADFIVQSPDAPVVSNILGRFLKVTDYGVREDILRAKEKVKRENARGILDAREAAYALVEGKDVTNEQLLALAQKPDVVNRAMMLALARKYGMVYFEEWMSAGSNAEKFAVLATMMEKNALSYQDVTGLASPQPAEKLPAPVPKQQEYPGLNIKELLEKETRK